MVELLLCLVLGGVWVWSALHKALDAREAIIALSWGLALTYDRAWWVLHAVVLLEWALGCGLILGVWRRGALGLQGHSSHGKTLLIEDGLP